MKITITKTAEEAKKIKEIEKQMDKALRVCPFCHYKNLHINHTTGDNEISHCLCNKCGTEWDVSKENKE